MYTRTRVPGPYTHTHTQDNKKLMANHQLRSMCQDLCDKIRDVAITI